jgi:hypothetical protein
MLREDAGTPAGGPPPIVILSTFCASTMATEPGKISSAALSAKTVLPEKKHFLTMD